MASGHVWECTEGWRQFSGVWRWIGIKKDLTEDGGHFGAGRGRILGSF